MCVFSASSMPRVGRRCSGLNQGALSHDWQRSVTGLALGEGWVGFRSLPAGAWRARASLQWSRDRGQRAPSPLAGTGPLSRRPGCGPGLGAGPGLAELRSQLRRACRRNWTRGQAQFSRRCHQLPIVGLRPGHQDASEPGEGAVPQSAKVISDNQGLGA